MSVTVTLGMTTWNQGVGVLSLTTSALIRETDRLALVGISSRIHVVDNKSWDGTAECLSSLRKMDCVQVPQSVGVSSLRNIICDWAALNGSDYVAFIDGDIGVIPHSLVSMIRHLELHPDLSAIGMDPLSQVREWDLASPYCHSVEKTRADALMYLCGYGVFRRSVFDTIRFDDSGPFGHIGWGSEDDDLYLQMVEANLISAYVEGFSFYHGTPRSSWASLKHLGIDPIESFEARRDYLMQKWRGKQPQRVHSGHLNILKGQQLHA